MAGQALERLFQKAPGLGGTPRLDLPKSHPARQIRTENLGRGRLTGQAGKPGLVAELVGHALRAHAT